MICDISVEAVYEASECVVKSSLSCVVCLVVNYVEA